LTNSVGVAEVTRGYRVSPTPLFMLPVNRDHEMLHEVSGVKVPRPASPFITHETPLSEGMAVAVSRGKCMDELINSSTWCDRE
jgi:hypothetical protein